jgi:hypothetical protein
MALAAEQSSAVASAKRWCANFCVLLDIATFEE